jgi:hypothetical protein
MRPPARTSGCAGFARNRKSNVRSAQFRQFLPVTDNVISWHLSGFDPAGSRSSRVFTRCFRMRLVSSWPSISTRTDVRKEAVIGAKANAGVTIHRFGQDEGAQSPRRNGRNRFLEEQPDMSAAAGARSFEGSWNSERTPALEKPDRTSTSEAAERSGQQRFVDDNIAPYVDQWAFLQSVSKIPRIQVEELVRDVERSGRVVGVRLPQMEEEERNPGPRRRPAVGSISL